MKNNCLCSGPGALLTRCWFLWSLLQVPCCGRGGTRLVRRTIIVSKATKRHCVCTVQKQVRLEPRPEDSYERCGSHKISETVPEASSGDRISSVTDGRQSGAADNQWRRWTGTKSLTSLDICHLTKLDGKVSHCRALVINNDNRLFHKDPTLIRFVSH